MKREWVRVGGGWGQVSTNRQTVVDKVRENRSGGEEVDEGGEWAGAGLQKLSSGGGQGGGE